MTSRSRYRLLLPQSIYDEMVAHARNQLPAECCGLLAGKPGEPLAMPAALSVGRYYPLGNALASPTEYESESRSLIAAFRDMRERQWELLAIFHSHPTSPPKPSSTDLERNYYGDTVMHLILSLSGPAPELRGWWLLETDSEEAEWAIA